MFTRVEHPFLDRDADVPEFDHRWTPNRNWRCAPPWSAATCARPATTPATAAARCWSITTTATAGASRRTRCTSATGCVPTTSGYLERNDFNYLRYQGRAPGDGPAAGFVLLRASTGATRFRAATTTTACASPMRGRSTCSATAAMAATSSSKSQASPRPRRPGHARQRRGRRAGQVLPVFRAVHAAQGPLVDVLERALRRRRACRPGLGGAMSLDFNPTYFVNDNLSFYGGETCSRSTTRTGCWCPQGRFPVRGQGGRDLLGSYRRTSCTQRRHAVDHQREAGTADQDGNHRPSTRTRCRAGNWRRTANLRRVPDALNDFSLRNPVSRSATATSFARRCRTCTSPTCAAASGFRDQGQDVGGLLGDAFSLRDDEQLFVKLSYRFEL